MNDTIIYKNQYVNPPIGTTALVPKTHSSSTSGMVLRAVNFMGTFPLPANS